MFSDFLGRGPKEGMLSHIVGVLHFLRRLHTVFRSLCSRQQCTKLLFSPRSLQHLLFLVLSIMAGLTAVR